MTKDEQITRLRAHLARPGKAKDAQAVRKLAGLLGPPNSLAAYFQAKYPMSSLVHLSGPPSLLALLKKQ